MKTRHALNLMRVAMIAAFLGFSLPAKGDPSGNTASPVKLTEDQARAVVVITGDNAEGTGFLVKTPDGPAVVTNIHVIANNPNLKITTNSGAQITFLSLKGATDRDLVMMAIKDQNYSYLDLATDISGTVEPGDEVITPGNSEGGGVILNTDGKVLGIGPDRIEFDNPIYHGNSGGPVFHVKSGKVIGVVTEVVKVETSDEVDKNSFASGNSAIRSSMRYFGLRLDTVPKWEAYDWNNFQIETTFLDQFDARNRCLHSYLYALAHDEKKSAKQTPEKKQEARLWLTDPQIVKANKDCLEKISDAGSSPWKQKNAIKGLLADLKTIANTNLDAIQNPANFYAFELLRTKDEIAYRKALIAELVAIRENVSRMSALLPKSDQ
jgi:hypothetical protein